MTLRLDALFGRVGARTHPHEVNLELPPGNISVVLSLTVADKISLTRLLPARTGGARGARCGAVWDVDTGWRPGELS
jgi:hypothetical protein